jgi:hypothetical protein
MVNEPKGKEGLQLEVVRNVSDPAGKIIHGRVRLICKHSTILQETIMPNVSTLHRSTHITSNNSNPSQSRERERERVVMEGALQPHPVTLAW